MFITSQQVGIEVIRMGSVESPRTVTGVIIREEKVYFAESEGQLHFTVGDFERVRPNAEVCHVQNKDAVDNLSQSMADIEEQIMELQWMRQDITAIDPAVQRINGQLKNIIDSRVHHFTALSVNEVYSLKESLTQMINTRNQMIVDEHRNTRQELGQAQQNLIQRIGMYTTPMRTEQSGIVSRIIDGFEDIFTKDNMKNLSREETLFFVDYDKIIPSREVEYGDPAFKIVTSNIWYIAAYFPNDLIEGFEENQQRTLFIENNGEFEPISVRIEQLDRNFNDSFLLLRCTKNIIDFLNTRRVYLRTTESVRTGLKISNSAIVNRDFFAIPHEYIFDSERMKYVLKHNAESPMIIPVEIIESDERFVYVPLETEGLRVNDEIINREHPDDRFTLYEFITVQGVFRANNGYAEFRRIVTDENSGGGGFIILSPSLNPGVRVFDQIVTTGAGIRDGQIIN
jgi:hypothetical protein